MAASEPPQPILRPTARDAEALWELSIEAGWNQVAADWRLMIQAGHAFAIKDAEGSFIASALTIPLARAIWWISMVLVRKPQRGRGYGTALLARVIAEVEAQRGAMGLDATEFGRPIYLPLGFRDVHPQSRWSAREGVRDAIGPPAGIALRSATEQDLSRIAQYDAARGGFARSSVLADLLARAPHLAQVAERAGGDLAGYVLGRNGYRATHIGPIGADAEAIALALLSSAMAAADRQVIVDVPDHHQGVGRWLGSKGATVSRRYMRMLRGTAPAVEDGSHVFAIAGPELG